MILLREIQEADLDSLEKFSHIPGLYNLPNDRDILREKIQRSVASFNDKLTNRWDSKFLFVAQDWETRKIVATSMIASQHGTPESPHFYFEVGSEERFSETINTGFIHGTLKLKYDNNGPTEIGGLVADPEFRNNEARLGRQISFVRFLFVALHRSRFKKKIIAELLPPLNKKGQSPLWEAIGRRFTNMDYWEADQLCQRNKEFIFSLFPAGKIYTTFLPAEARNSIGKVGKETEPVVHMMRKIGFDYKNHVDPFDGGPHLWAQIDDLAPIKKTRHYRWAGEGQSVDAVAGLLTAEKTKPGEFRAVSVQACLPSLGTPDSKPELKIVGAPDASAEQVASVLGIREGDPVVFMPYY